MNFFSSKSKLAITLWGSYVDQVFNFLSKGSQGAVVIVFQFCKIKEYASTRSLSNSISAVMITSTIEAAFSSVSLSPVEDLEHSGNGDIICIHAQVHQVNKERDGFMMHNDDVKAVWPKKLDSFVGTKFVSKIEVKVSDWSHFKYLTVQRMTNVSIIMDKFYAQRLAKIKNKGSANMAHGDTIDLSLVVDDLTTPVNTKASERAEVEACRLSFSKLVASPSAETPIACKRAVIDLSDEVQSSVNSVGHCDVPMNKTKLDRK
ncbi:replication protein A 70 kDa DNA-binding subunit B-like [Senna tora]|uniref:Replication protein A 70 kDa DNA-binding subunit B-like n=1 Tax=Senna tora TaxID=362788 RepID=A0A834W7Z3_9FABA|nr:replication protein A 70 kDa DNA-binding subunit B-like [Senna tora]